MGELDFPFSFDRLGRTAATDRGDHIRDLIEEVLLTAPGERVMRPDFGTGLRALVFEPINTTTIALAKHRVEQALTLWEPRIDQVSVTVSADPPNGLLQITVTYRVRRTNTFYNLVYPFFMNEGGV